MKTFFLTIKNWAFLQNYLWLFLILIPFSSSFSQNFCRPDSQTNTVGGALCVGMSVTTPDDAIDGNMATFASISNVLGLACFAQETFHFNQTAKAGDQIVVYFNTGNGVLEADLLTNGTIRAKNGVTNVGPAVALSNGILNLQILDDVNKIGVIKYTLPGDANSVQIQSGGLLSALLSLRIYEVRLQFAKPTIVGGNTQAVCSGQPITLTATAAAGTTLAWYDSPTSTTALSNINTFTTPALTTATTYYVSSSRIAGCESDERVPVTINITNPVLPTIDVTGTVICSTGPTQSTTLSVINPVPGTTYTWYSAVGSFIASGNTLTRTVPIGVSNFFVEAAIGTCKTPTRTPVSVTSTLVPDVPKVLTQSVSILSGQNATLNASSTDPSVTFDWYDTATGGTKLLANSPTYTTPILTANKTYYVEAVSATGGCVSATRAAINVTVVTNPLGGCLDANSQQTTQNGLCLFCSSPNSDNSVDGSSSTAARLSVPVGLVDGWIQQTLQFNNPGQAGDVITVDLEIPTGLLDISALSYISLATYNGATYNNDRIAVNNSLLNIELLGGNRFKASLKAGAAFDRVEIRLGGLATVLTSLDIYGASYKFKARTITGNTTICSGQIATLTSSATLDETINWYSALTGGTLLSSTATYTTLALTSNTTFYVEVTRNGCVNSERFPVLVTVNNPVAPTTVVASPVNLCSGQNTTITVQSPVAGTDYNWYSTASGGTSLFTGTSFITPSLTTTTSYYVEAKIGSCLSATRTQVTVNVSARPAVPTVALTNVVIQAGQSATLEVSNPVGGIDYDWYDAPINGNLLASATNSYTPTPALTVNKSFYITARSTATDCISATRAVINVVISNSINSCLLADSQVTTKGGTTNCLTCGSTNDGDSVDGNNTTAANLTIPLGLLGDHIQQVLSFSTAGETGDIIDVELGIPVGLLDISALSNISLQSFNSGLPNADQSAISSLLNVQLLGGNRFRASFVAAGPFTSVQVKLEGLAALLAGVDIYEASYRYPNATITGAVTPICVGQSTTLTATATGTQTFSWYDVPTGGTALATNTSTYGTGSLTGTEIFYLEASRGVTTPCLNTNRQAITVTVLPIPTDTDIVITTPLTASCAGGAVLTPTSTLPGATFKYYTDQNKTIEIVSGEIAGVTYLKNATTGALTISGLIASNSPYKYYISVLNEGICENINGTLKEVIVNYPVGAALTVTTTLAGCAKVNLKDAITDLDTSGNTTYTFFDSSNAPMTEQAAANIIVGGDYWIQAQTIGVDCPSVKEKVTVTINPLPTLVVTTASKVVNKGDSVALVATSNGTITWYDPAGNPIPSNNTGVLNTVGVFTYTVIASNGTCTNTQTITITVIDPASCDPLLEREYATTQQWGTIITGTVTNDANGADGNPKTYSTITTGLGLLGIGTTWQNLQWPTTIAKGTPVTVKLGAEYSGVALGQGVTVIGTKRDGLGNPIDIGTLQSVSGSLLNLLSGQNSFEYTFVPSDATGPKAYDGIRVQMGSVLSVAQNINVYDAYYDKSVTQITCGQGDIEDVFFGVKEIGVGALTATVGVSNAWNIADGDVATYATMFSGVGVLAAAQLTTSFRTPSMVGDSLRIIISKPGIVLNLNLLTGFNIQLYLGNTPVGAPILNDSSLLTLKLLSGDTMAMTILAPQTQPYDRVTISFGGVASVLDQLRVHNIDRVTNTKVIGGDDDNNVTVCPGSTLTLQVPPANCSSYKWYNSPTGGNELASGQTYTLPATLAAGTYKYYVQPIRYGCPALERGVVTVIVRATTPAGTIASVKINDDTSNTICAEDGKVKLEAVLASTPVLNTPVYHWYIFDGTTSNLIAGETSSVLNLTGLTPGTYTYYVGVNSNEYCETAPGDRKLVIFTILPNSLVTDITVNNDSVCHDTDAVFTPESALTNPKFFWYFDANKTQPIPSGPGPVTIAGVTYTTSSLGVLTVSGLTAVMSPVTYYVAVSSDNTCENKAGELKVATVTVTSPATPTTLDDTPTFCLTSNPTIASLQVNEPNVVWYDSLISTTPLPSTTVLTSKAYYGAISLPIKAGPPVVYCESAVRLVVTVTVTDPGTPTLVTAGVQNFCLINAPTFASVQFNEANIVWY
ncbi:hypothetical protein LPB87_16920, partial [Flavobacterium sp. EDS]|nr:hypothetical protein [Flavobacterium sp. EDS]